MSKLFNYSINIERRLFYVFAWTAAIANTLGFISNVIFFGFDGTTIFCGVCALLMLIIGCAGVRSEKTELYALIMVVILIVFEFPFLYYMYGPGRGGYMFLGIVGILIFLKKRWRIKAASVAIAYYAVIVAVTAIYPSQHMPEKLVDDLGATLMTFLIAAVSSTIIITLLIVQYERQNRELNVLTEELRAMADLDPLTRLYNRRYLTDYLDRKMASNSSPFAVALLDLDDFKSVNDIFGHLYGDQVLQSFADSMKAHMNDKGIAARFGGEEFMLVFEEPDQRMISETLESVQSDLTAFSEGSRNIQLTFSGGVEVFRQNDRVTQLFNAADEKLYAAKKNGKQRVVFDDQNDENV